MTRAKIKEMSCNGGNGDISITPSTPVACTMEYRACADGSAMPRDSNCKWREDKCSTVSPPATSIESEKRRSDMKYIFMALSQYMEDNNGKVPSSIIDAMMKSTNFAATEDNGRSNLGKYIFVIID
jgi:hypothetical protein